METKEIKAIPRMATLVEAAATTNLSYYTIREWCLSGDVAYVRAGGPRGKILVNMDKLIAYLNGGEGNDE